MEDPLCLWCREARVEIVESAERQSLPTTAQVFTSGRDDETGVRAVADQLSNDAKPLEIL
jgi:hypothetical protein